LWNHEQWAAYVKEKTPQYDTLAAAAFRNP
jgi:hypothetical protein